MYDDLQWLERFGDRTKWYLMSDGYAPLDFASEAEATRIRDWLGDDAQVWSPWYLKRTSSQRGQQVHTWNQLGKSPR